jgi:hypothetical protein
MVEVCEWIAQIFRCVPHLSGQIFVVRVLHDEGVIIIISVEAGVVLFVVAIDVGEAGVCLKHTLFLLQISS